MIIVSYIVGWVVRVSVPIAQPNLHFLNRQVLDIDCIY